ncbi:PLP-dependent transferase [Rhizodiscina lignyota]|uniref:sphinganine-1-phosphate aldolase n=1 Tax=Rhizodiscina lignyota TaxID=1504668 RepID=A0A9P4M162_9PEZI|nr:PLP-dependent transferase [Rhizodiscina lignyota]
MASRLPVSLRDTFTTQSGSRPGRLLAFNLDLLRNILLVLFLLRWTRKAVVLLYGYGPIGTLAQLWQPFRAFLYRSFLSLPGISGKVAAQVNEGIGKIEKGLLPTGPDVVRYATLPKEGWGKDKVLEELGKIEGMKHTRWEEGRVSGAVYHGGKDLVDVQTKAWGMFSVANPIHPDVFPGVRKMEAEIVSMVLALFNAPEDAAGVTTSGGTESILMACLGARNKAYKERGVTEPEMIIPHTAHAAFLKACEYFNITARMVPCPAPSYKVSTRTISRLVNRNTILIVGSAPNYPHGVIDDITALSRIALRKNIPLHVDCCLGSFMMPYLERAGFESEPFDFRLKGVTSISVDTHKYGFAPKGNSTVLYRNKQLRAYQYFITPDWPGGVYGSPSIAGSRPGALIAGCWASMMSMGEDGYIKACHSIVSTRSNIEDAIKNDERLSSLSVIGRPLVSVVAFRSDIISIWEIADGMSARGWHLNALQSPPGVHVAVTVPIVPVWKELVEDLATVVTELREKREQAIAKGEKPQGGKGDAVALYGVAGSLPDKTIVRDLARGFLDTLYKA